MYIKRYLKMKYEVWLADELLNGTSTNYEKFNKETRLYLLKVFNNYIINNKGIFCLEKKAFKRYYNIIKSLGHLGYDTLLGYTILNEIKIMLSNKEKYNFYLEKYIGDVLKNYKNENEIVTSSNRIKQIKKHFKLLFFKTDYFLQYVDGLYLVDERCINREWLENSLKYLIKKDNKNIIKYRTYIQFYYENTGINLLGLATTNIINFSLKKVKNGI